MNYYRMESATIRVGSTYRSSGGSTYSSRMLIQHPSYNTTNSDYDVAVIRVFRRINIDGVNSSLVYTPNYSCVVPAGTNLTITGWGDTSVSMLLSLPVAWRAVIGGLF